MTSSSIQDVSGIYYARRTKGTQNGTSDTDDISGMFQNAMNMAKNQSVSRAADQTDAGKNTIQSDTKTAYGMTQNVSRTYPFSNSQKIKETGSDDATVKDNTDTEDKIVKKIADKLQVSEDVACADDGSDHSLWVRSPRRDFRELELYAALLRYVRADMVLLSVWQPV